MLGTVLKAAVALIGCLVLGDVAGMIFLAIVEVLPFDLFSGPLTYVVWFVFGIFTGLIAYNAAGTWSTPNSAAGADWTSYPPARQIGRTIVVVQSVVIVALSVLFDWLYWSKGVAGDYYVPDSAPHSITYFVAVAGAIIFGSVMLMPTRGKPAR